MNKDWGGNRRTTFACLGASNHTDKERQEHDYYATDPIAIDKLIAAYPLPHVICEPCCGEGHLSKRLAELGHKVYSSDIVDRGFGDVLNFADMETLPDDCQCILTNPPYRYATDVILHALDLLPEGGVCAMFLKTQYLEGKERHRRVFSVCPPKYVFQFIGRTVCAKNGDFKAMEKTGSAVAFARFIWEKGFVGSPTLRWI